MELPPVVVLGVVEEVVKLKKVEFGDKATPSGLLKAALLPLEESAQPATPEPAKVVTVQTAEPPPSP